MNIGFSMRSAFERATRDAAGGLSSLASACLSNFEDLINALQTWGQVEHNEDGSHAEVTADSIEVSDITALGKVRMSNIVTYHNHGILATSRIDDLYVAGLETANVLKIHITHVGTTITGISALGRRIGDLLLVINDDPHTSGPGPDFSLAAADANSEAANRFIGSVASGTPWTVQASEGLLLMYDEFSQTENVYLPGWRVIAR